jgi:hypothetical protein
LAFILLHLSVHLLLLPLLLMFPQPELMASGNVSDLLLELLLRRSATYTHFRAVGGVGGSLDLTANDGGLHTSKGLQRQPTQTPTERARHYYQLGRNCLCIFFVCTYYRIQVVHGAVLMGLWYASGRAGSRRSRLLAARSKCGCLDGAGAGLNA